MDLRPLRYVVVTEELHFSRAASRLNIVQPALSMQIKALEEELGARLFQRNRRGVERTEAGRLFVAEAQRTLDQANRAREVARKAGDGHLGWIKIGYTAGAAYSGVLGQAVQLHREAAPEWNSSWRRSIRVPSTMCSRHGARTSF